MAKFAANFWGADFCTTAGYDTLVKRLKDGKKTCQEFEEYLERRAKIEKEYGESLIQLARRPSGKEEIGTLRKAWDQLKTESETIGKMHVTLGQRLLEEVHHSAKEFREQQRDVRKKSEDTVKRSAAHKKTCFERNNRMRVTYETKCRDADKAEENCHRLQSNPATKSKDLTQAQRRMEVARATANNADTQYQESVRHLEEARFLWDREMELLCRQFQELEEQRIAFLRHQLWTYSNLLSQNTVAIDDAAENVRKVLEDCNVDADIDLFVHEKATGSERPAPIPYLNYYHPTHPSEGGVLGGVGLRASGSSPLPDHTHKELPPLPIEELPLPIDGTGFESVYSSIPEDLKVDTSAVMDEGYYAAPKALDKVIAVYSYIAQGDQELTIEEGDIVNVIAKEDTVWWCGERRGKVGMFPVAYVETYDGEEV